MLRFRFSDVVTNRTWTRGHPPRGSVNLELREYRQDAVSFSTNRQMLFCFTVDFVDEVAKVPGISERGAGQGMAQSKEAKPS